MGSDSAAKNKSASDYVCFCCSRRKPAPRPWLLLGTFVSARGIGSSSYDGALMYNCTRLTITRSFFTSASFLWGTGTRFVIRLFSEARPHRPALRSSRTCSSNYSIFINIAHLAWFWLDYPLFSHTHIKLILIPQACSWPRLDRMFVFKMTAHSYWIEASLAVCFMLRLVIMFSVVQKPNIFG